MFFARIFNFFAAFFHFSSYNMVGIKAPKMMTQMTLSAAAAIQTS